MILGVYLARWGKTDWPSATTKPSLSLHDSWGSLGSTALKATDSSSVQSGWGSPNSS